MKLLTLFPPTVALDNRPKSWTRVIDGRTFVKNGRNNMLYARYWRGHEHSAAIAMHELREARAKWRNPFIDRYRLNNMGEATECVVERDHYGMDLTAALFEGMAQLGHYDNAPDAVTRLAMLSEEVPVAERWVRRNRKLLAKALRFQG